MNTATQNRVNSAQIYARACKVFPGGVNSPVRAFKNVEMLPLIAREGKEDMLWDEEGNQYIDFCSFWGALMLGHANKKVAQRIAEQLPHGMAFGTTSMHEILLGEKILSHFPSCEKIRFVVTGTEATMSAIRIARRVTERSLIVKFDGQYHGHSDALLVAAGSGAASIASGIEKEHVCQTVSLPFNEIETCRTFLRMQTDLAAVIVEPVSANMGVIAAEPGFLEMLREETTRLGALLIFDEIVTGYRSSLGGVSSQCGIIPDLTCLGKIIGGGLPVAAFGGKREYMDQLAPFGDIYQAGTFAGHPIGMIAGLETLNILEEKRSYSELLEATESFLKPMREVVADRDLPIVIHAFGSMFSFFFGIRSVRGWKEVSTIDKGMFRAFYTYLFERGIYFSPSPYEAQFVTFAHSHKHLEDVQAIICEFLFLM